MDENLRIGLAEAVGTAVLVIVGPGAAILSDFQIGQVGVALAFGLALLTMCYTIGHVSGCHINPAVTIGMWTARRIETKTLPYYFGGQIGGGLVGALLLLAIASGKKGFSAKTSGFAANGWGVHSPGSYSLAAVGAVEIICTAIFVLVVLAATRKGAVTGIAGVVIGLGLTMVHLVSIPVSNTSVNPARSIATAVMQHGWAMGQLWAFIAFPLMGGMAAAGIWLALNPDELAAWEAAGVRPEPEARPPI